MSPRAVVAIDLVKTWFKGQQDVFIMRSGKVLEPSIGFQPFYVVAELATLY